MKTTFNSDKTHIKTFTNVGVDPVSAGKKLDSSWVDSVYNPSLSPDAKGGSFFVRNGVTYNGIDIPLVDPSTDLIFHAPSPKAAYIPSYSDYSSSPPFDEEVEEDHSFKPPKKSLADYKSSYNNLGISTLDKVSVSSKVSSFLKTKNKCFIYRILFSDYSHILERACGSQYEEEQIGRFISEDIEHILHQLDRDVKFSSRKIDISEVISIIQDVIAKLYSKSCSPFRKDIYITIDNTLLLIDTLKTCREKGIILDDVISELRSINFQQRHNTRLKVCLLYIPCVNTLAYDSYSFDADFSGIQTFKTLVEDLSVVDKLEGGDTIKINDIPYNKKSFESLVETNFDTFIQNLEIDALLDKKDTEAVDLSNLL